MAREPVDYWEKRQTELIKRLEKGTEKTIDSLIQSYEKATKDIEKKLSKNEYIIRSKYLKSTVKESIVEVEMFFAVYEDITDYAEIG